MSSPEAIIAGAANLWAHDYAGQIAQRAMLKLHEHGYVISRNDSPSFAICGEAGVEPDTEDIHECRRPHGHDGPHECFDCGVVIHLK